MCGDDSRDGSRDALLLGLVTKQRDRASPLARTAGGARRLRHCRLCTLLWILAAAICFHVQPAAAAQRLSQAAHSVWRIQDGLFGSPNAITQTSDGYIWIGTDHGLVRFDGVRFVDCNAITGFPDAEFRAGAVLGTKDGSLWVATTKAVVRLKDGKATHYAVPSVPSVMVEDGESSIWLVETRGPGGAPLCHLSAGHVQCFGPPTIPLNYGSALARERDGTLWLGSTGGLCRWQPYANNADCYLEKVLEPFAGLTGVSSILPREADSPLVGIARAGNGLGLGTLADGRLESFNLDGLDGSHTATSAIFQDHRSALWIGTAEKGIIRIQNGYAEHFGEKEGLSSDEVTSIFEDQEGVVWVLTSAGIDSFRPQAVSVFSTREGLTSNGVESVLPMKNGDVWLGNTTLSVLRGDRVITPEHAELFADKAVTSLLQDTQDRVWIGLDRTLQIYQNGTLAEVRGMAGNSVGVVQALVEDGAHDIWVSTVAAPHRLLRIRAAKVVDEIDTDKIGDPISFAGDPNAGIWLGYRDGRIAHHDSAALEIFPADEISKRQVRSLYIEESGALLAATSAGMLLQAKGRRQLLDADHGLPCASIHAVVEDMSGSVWLNASCGLVSISKTEIDRWRTNPSAVVKSRLFDISDGVQGGYAAFLPRAKLARNGRLWFATSKFAEVIDPASDSGAAPVSVRIEEFVADRKPFSFPTRIVVPALTRDISVRYTALRTVTPQRVVFQTQLQGRDEGWGAVGTRRESFYTDLAPGTYTFLVRASRDNEQWSEPAAIAFEVPPLFYQTRWFLAACVAALMLVVYAGLLLRVRQVAVRLERQMRAKSLERERIARNLHDTLLQDTQALVLSFQTVAEQLPSTGSARQLMERVLDRADLILAEGRDAVLDLRDPDARISDLPESLTEVGNELAASNGPAFSTIVEGTPRPLSPIVRDEAYSIGREALINAFQHSQAAQIEVQLNYGQHSFTLQVRDDGKGIDATTLRTGQKAGHWGLTGMRERAREIGGKLDIWSGSRPGTEIQLQIPARIAYRPSDSVRVARWKFWRRRASAERH